MQLRGINWAENNIPVYILVIRIIHNIRIFDAQWAKIGLSGQLIPTAYALVNWTLLSDKLTPHF